MSKYVFFERIRTMENIVSELPNEVKNNAKYVTDEDNNNDGVAKFLMNYLNK